MPSALPALSALSALSSASLSLLSPLLSSHLSSLVSLVSPVLWSLLGHQREPATSIIVGAPKALAVAAAVKLGLSQGPKTRRTHTHTHTHTRTHAHTPSRPAQSQAIHTSQGRDTLPCWRLRNQPCIACAGQGARVCVHLCVCVCGGSLSPQTHVAHPSAESRGRGKCSLPNAHTRRAVVRP